jgi:hypothetical protein
MHAETVMRAVNQLRAQGQRISVRHVHARVGGSRRDILRHVQA